MRCSRCGSYAINPNHHGREPDIDLDLCDVCYWRKRSATRPDGVVEALKLAYRKHWLNDDSIGWDELGDKLCDALCNAMGDKEFSLWLQQMKAAVGGE